MVLAERLVGEARERRARGMDSGERTVTGVSALAYLVIAVALAILLPNERHTDWLLILGLTVGYALAERVRFEFAGNYGTAEQLFFVPIVLLAPLPLVPVLIGAASVIGIVPEVLRGSWHRQRFADRLSDCWFCLTPVLVLVALDPGEPTLGNAAIYALALGAQMAGEVVYALVRNRLLERFPVRELLSAWLGSARIDAIFSPIAYLITLPAVDAPVVLLALAPFTLLLKGFAHDREERYAKTLELHRAYRGTVMLLSDVVEFEDDYTAQHSRSVVDLVNAVADELRLEINDRQELEFGAMLHDVGKIAIPKEILNKPSSLTDQEFEVMKTHTIEGQFMLDRVGGLLGRVGEVVRSCHERWDGAGYPDGLAGEEIPLFSRIVFTCDAYHAMTSDRVYRAAMSRQAAVEELLANSGTQFDPRIVAAVAKVVEHGQPRPSAADEVRLMLSGARAPGEVSAPIAS